MGLFWTLLTTSLFLFSYQAIADTRLILAPYSTPNNPINNFSIDHKPVPADQFNWAIRYQNPSPTISAIQYPTGYNAGAYTGLVGLKSKNQRGPIGGNAEQSTYQLSKKSFGVFMRSSDSPHPSKLTVCQPNCSGYQKHSIYEYRFSTPRNIFSSQSTNNSLDVEMDFHVQTFTHSPPVGVLAGQVAIVLFLKDGNGNTIQYVVFVFDSWKGNDGAEGLSLEIIGAGDNGYFVSSSFRKDRPMTYTTIPTNSDIYRKAPWPSNTHFKFQITKTNLLNAIHDLNAKGGNLSTDLMSYKISQIGLNHEVYYENNGDTWILGASGSNLKVSETYTPTKSPLQ